MTDQSQGRVFRPARLLEKRMPAEARVLLEPLARCHVAHAVAEDAAEVPHLFPESRGGRVGIVVGVKQQRMPALRADVFVTAVPVGQLFVVMPAEEA